jgi:Flp pilus assembly secretin CpaC
MRRLRIAAVAALLFALPALAPAATGTLMVNVDQGARVSLSRPARDIVVANPGIADVTLLDANNIVVLGKAVGSTSLLVVDAAGRTILDRQVVVSTPDGGRMSFYRGAAIVQDFACSPRCAQVGGKGESAPAPSPAP